MTSTVEMWQINKSFGDVPTVRDVSMKVENRQCLCILGPSGCGKTTSLRMIAGLEDPDAGKILINGVDVTRLPPYARDIGMVFQDYALFPHMSVEQNIAFGLRHRGVPRDETADRIAEMLSLVRLSGFAHRKPAQLSGGQQQRVALARALATRPAVLLLDEPLSNLDAKLREELRVEIREILDAARTTTILVTHDQDEAMALGDRIVVMRQGQVEQEGSPIEVYDHPRTRFVAEFVGRSNWLRGVATETDPSGRTRFELEGGGFAWVMAPEARPAGLYDLCVRPERLSLMDDEAQGSADPAGNILLGSVRYSEPLAARLHIHVDLPNKLPFLAVIPRSGFIPPNGSTVRLTFRAEDAFALSPEAGRAALA